jgi:hypothetical protein
MISIPTNPNYHLLFDALAWATGLGVGVALYRWRLKEITAQVARVADGGYFASLVMGAVLGAHVGACLNGDGAYQGFDLNGKPSFEIGFSALFPLANEVSLVAEVQSQTARFDNTNPSPNNLIGAESATSILGGINWRAFGRGVLRGAVSFGLTEGAPDFSVLMSYAYTF